jgi:hypothetical protein
LLRFKRNTPPCAWNWRSDALNQKTEFPRHILLEPCSNAADVAAKVAVGDGNGSRSSGRQRHS